MDTYRSSEHFAPLLGYCDHQVQKVLHRDLKSAGYDVSPMQCRTLTFLHCQGGQTTQKALEQHLLVKPSTVNGIVSRLEGKGLLTRSQSADDARCRVLRLTPLGQGFHQDLARIARQVSCQMEQGFTPEEIATLTGYLKRIARNLNTPKEGAL